MWDTKTFKTYEQQQLWINRNKDKYMIDEIYIDNNGNKNDGYAVEYKKYRIL